MGKKYIIELEDKPFHKGNGDFLYRVKGFNSLVFDMTGVGKLTPYPEPDMEQVRKDGYENGYKNGFVAGHLKAEKSGQSFYEDGYRCGLNDAWECTRKIYDISQEDRLEIFPEASSFVVADICDRYSASECIEKIRQYEQEKEEQIQVVDEVRSIHHGWTAVVSAIDRECMTLMDTNGELGDGYDVNRFTKTGRHFPEIDEVLQKMKETDNG